MTLNQNLFSARYQEKNHNILRSYYFGQYYPLNSTIHVEPAVVPIHHIFDDDIIDFAFGFENFEDFIAKQLFKLTGIRRRAYHVSGISYGIDSSISN